jgi:ammonium transporter, Amt family
VNDSALALLGVMILLVPLAGAGLALMNSGLGRSRSAAHAMLSPLCMIAVAVLVYFACGWSWQSFPGRPAHTIALGGSSWDLIAAEPWFLRGVAINGSPVSLVVWLQMFSVALASLIPAGAASERWRLGASCASTALLAGVTYPLFAHWVWGGGWLAQLGTRDLAGSGAIQAVGGISALAVAWVLGPRRGKYDAGGMPAAFPGHNAVLVLFGCFLTWLGWIGLNGAGSILMGGESSASLPLVAMNTTLAAAGGLLAAAVFTRARFGRPDASLCVNGWTGGLVASSAACAWITPAAAAAVGALAGVLVTLSVEWLDSRLRVDDPAGSISVHAVGGLWGLLTAALFGPANLGPQLAGIATLLLVVLPIALGLNWLLNRFYPMRISAEGEADGLDLAELGAGAYPDFVTRRDDFRPR